MNLSAVEENTEISDNKGIIENKQKPPNIVTFSDIVRLTQKGEQSDEKRAINYASTTSTRR